MDLEVIRRILIEAKTAGVEQTTAQLKGLSTGYEGVTVASQKTESATESITRKFQQLESRLDPTSRAARQLAKDIATLDAQLAQTGNLERHGELLNVATQNAIKMSGGAKAATGVMEGFKQTISGVSGQLVGMAAGMGPVGIFLSALGSWGIAAAVGLNLVSSAIDKVRETASTAGQKARDLVELSEATKLSIDELRGMKQAASQFGVGEDQIEGWITKASVSMEKARTGSGELADALRSISPSFLEALQNADTMAERLDVLARAAQAAKDQGKDVAVFWRDVFGRGSGRADLVMQATQLAGGIAAVGNTMRQYGGAAAEEIRHRAELSEVNKKLTKESEALNATLLQSTEALKAENAALELSNAAKRRAIELEKEMTAAGITGSRVLSANRDRQREQAVSRYTGNLPPPSANLPPLPTAEMAAATDAATKLRKELDSLTTAQKNYNDNAIKVGALGAAATSAEKASVAADKLKVSLEEGAFGQKDSAQALELYNRALASVAVQAKALTAVHDAAIQTLRARTAAERQAAAAATVKASDSSGDANVHAQQAVAMEIEKQVQAHRDAMNAMQGQLQVAQAVTGIQKINAQEAATYRDLIDQGRTSEQASAEASKQKQIAIAQVNSAAKAQLLTLQDQYSVASAVTGAEKMHAAAANTTNALLRQGVDSYTAAAVGAQELANAQAAATSSVQQSITGLNQELEVLKASTQEEKDRVLARQAYDNAVASGASPEAARQLQAATEAVSSEKRRQSEENAKLKAQDEQRLALCKQMAAAEEEYSRAIEKIYAGQAQLIDQMGFSQPGGSGNQGMQGGKTGTVLSPEGQMIVGAIQQANERGQKVTYPGGPMANLKIEDTVASMRYDVEHMRMAGKSYEEIAQKMLQVKDMSLTGGIVVDLLQRIADENPDVAIRDLQYAIAQIMQKPPSMEKDDALKALNAQLKQLAPQAAAEGFARQFLGGTNAKDIFQQILGGHGAGLALQDQLAWAQKAGIQNSQVVEYLKSGLLGSGSTAKELMDAIDGLTDATNNNSNVLSGIYGRQFGQGFYDGGAAVGELIYGLDNNTGSAIDAMQHANDNNTRNQNNLLTNLSQNQVQSYAFYSGGIVSATNSVQSAVAGGFATLTATMQQQRAPTTPTTPSPTTPYPTTYPPPHIPGTPGFARGGSFTTAGYGGDNSNVVAFRVSPQRERVTITPMNGGNAGGSSSTINNNNNITVSIPQGTNEFRSSAMHVADEIFNQIAVAGRRR